MLNGNSKVVTLGFIIALGFVIGMLIFGAFFVKSRQENKSLRIVGYATKQFESDLVKWNLTVQKNSSLEGLKTAYKSLSADILSFKQYLVEQGIPDKEISIQPVTSFPMYDNNGHITSYNLNQNLFVITNQLNKIEELALNPDFFADKGLL
ncbi:MAG: SIMPL domain-containing protein, partial [Candidatus Cloacimonadaceae bacterium]